MICNIENERLKGEPDCRSWKRQPAKPCSTFRAFGVPKETASESVLLVLRVLRVLVRSTLQGRAPEVPMGLDARACHEVAATYADDVSVFRHSLLEHAFARLSGVAEQ